VVRGPRPTEYYCGELRVVPAPEAEVALCHIPGRVHPPGPCGAGFVGERIARLHDRTGVNQLHTMDPRPSLRFPQACVQVTRKTSEGGHRTGILSVRYHVPDTDVRNVTRVQKSSACQAGRKKMKGQVLHRDKRVWWDQACFEALGEGSRREEGR
jgi:hypothetical protein